MKSYEKTMMGKRKKYGTTSWLAHTRCPIQRRENLSEHRELYFGRSAVVEMSENLSESIAHTLYIILNVLTMRKHFKCTDATVARNVRSIPT